MFAQMFTCGNDFTENHGNLSLSLSLSSPLSFVLLFSQPPFLYLFLALSFFLSCSLSRVKSPCERSKG